MSASEELLAFQLKAAKIKFEREFRFHPTRFWRVDFRIEGVPLLVEIHGGQWMRGKSGHSSGSGLARDWDKSNNAQLLGYTYLQFGTAQVKSGEALKTIEAAIRPR